MQQNKENKLSTVQSFTTSEYKFMHKQIINSSVIVNMTQSGHVKQL